MSAPLKAASVGKRGQLSEHFRAAELWCPHCHACIVTDELVRFLERIRSALGNPLPIVSGYRCPRHNADVGGAADSQHMYGTAADIPRTRLDLHTVASLGAKGVGTRDGIVVHVDVRRGAFAHWTYDAHGNAHG
jgi:uncharacterized protein YcbK (DUF882 family)